MYASQACLCNSHIAPRRTANNSFYRYGSCFRERSLPQVTPLKRPYQTTHPVKAVPLPPQCTLSPSLCYFLSSKHTWPACVVCLCCILSISLTSHRSVQPQGPTPGPGNTCMAQTSMLLKTSGGTGYIAHLCLTCPESGYDRTIPERFPERVQ